MYPRPVFTEHNQGRIAALIEAYSFGLLVTTGANGMEASHVPFIVAEEEGRLVLTGHLGAANPQCAALDGGQGLAIFTGPHGYIAPSWYKTQPAVPTWDYAAVHIHGRLELVEDEARTAGVLRALAAQDPGQFDVDAMEPKFRAQMFRGIKAFRLPAGRIEAQWKMSQNRSAEDRRSVIAALRAQGNDACADLIAETL
jgi:transcriptional regulator